MIRREHDRHPGGILADEMGLGKTLTSIATIVLSQTRGLTTLVVMPLSLLEQWQNEIESYSDLRVFVHHGTRKAATASVFQRTAVVLTTYDRVQAEGATLMVRR